MAKRKPTPAPTAATSQKLGVSVRAVDRTRKTIQTWRQAMQSAESIVHPHRWAIQNLYTDILLDEHLVTVLTKSRLAVQDSTLLFLVDGKPDEALGDLIATQFFTDLLGHIHDSEPFGYSLVHFDPTNPERCDLVPRGHVLPTLGMVVVNPYDIAGYNYLDPSFLNHYLAVGRPDDLGLLLVAAPLVLMKRGDIQDWATFNEIFGMPLRVGTYDANNPQTKKLLEEMFNKQGAATWSVHPSGTEVKYEANPASGNAQNFDNFAARMDAGMSKLFLGQTLTTEVGKTGNMSTAQVHLAIEESLAKSRRNRALKVLNGRIRQMLVAWGYPQAEQGVFSFADEEEELPKDKQLEIALKVNAVAPVSKKWLYEHFSLPPAETEEDQTLDHLRPEPEAVPQEEEAKPTKKKKPTQNAAGRQSATFERFLATVRSFFEPAP